MRRGGRGRGLGFGADALSAADADAGNALRPAVQRLRRHLDHASPERQRPLRALLQLLAEGRQAAQATPAAGSAAANAAAPAASATPRPPAPRVCANPGCGATDGLRRCGGCSAVRYCGEACSHAHWRAHKAECRRVAAERQAAAEAAARGRQRQLSSRAAVSGCACDSPCAQPCLPRFSRCVRVCLQTVPWPPVQVSQPVSPVSDAPSATMHSIA